jgi:uncharacterized protein (TIGR03067 family)
MMRSAAWLLAVVLIGASVSSAADDKKGDGAAGGAARKVKKDDGKKDALKLQGAWTLESQEVGGKAADADAIKGMTLVIKDDKWLLSFGPGKPTNVAVIFIDPTKDPKLVEIRGPRGALLWSGLYKLDGDSLTICRPLRLGGARPKELKSSDTDMLWVWKRAGKAGKAGK